MKTSNIGIGIFVIGGLLLFGIGMFVIGDRHEMYVQQPPYGFIEGDRQVLLRRVKDDRPSAALEAGLRRPRLTDALRIHFLVRQNRLALHRGPFAALMEKAIMPVEVPAGDQEDRLERARRFAAARRLVPEERHCLIDSLALLQWLGPLRTSVRIVFGARLDPFAAHCWLEAGGMLLNDRLETIAQFTPVGAMTCLPAMQ